MKIQSAQPSDECGQLVVICIACLFYHDWEWPTHSWIPSHPKTSTRYLIHRGGGDELVLFAMQKKSHLACWIIQDRGYKISSAPKKEYKLPQNLKIDSLRLQPPIVHNIFPEQSGCDLQGAQLAFILSCPSMLPLSCLDCDPWERGTWHHLGGSNPWLLSVIPKLLVH